MATPIFDQRPKYITSWGYLGSRFFQKYRKVGYAPGAVVTATLYAYNQNGAVNVDPLAAELQPTITPVDANNGTLTFAGTITRRLTDPAYWMEYAVDGTVCGVTKISFSRDVPEDLIGKTGDDLIELSAGMATYIDLRNPDSEQGKSFVYPANAPAVHGLHLEHRLNTQFLKVTAWGVNTRERKDVTVISLQAVAGKDPLDWGYLVLPPTEDDEDRLVGLLIEPAYLF